MQTKKIVTAIAAVGLVAGVASAPHAAAGRASVHPKAPPTGVLVFDQFVDLDFSASRIAIADADGQNERPLSHPSAGTYDIDAEVSPDGTRVAYERDAPDGSAGIRLVRTDGTGDHALDLGCTGHCDADLAPAWTPDGRHLVFSRVFSPYPDGNSVSAVLWKTDLHGNNITRVSQPGIDGAFEDIYASFAPAGYMVFVRGRNADGHSAIFRMNLDGSHLVRLTPWSLDADLADVSQATDGPTKNLVVFETFGHGAPDGLSQAIATVSATCGKYKPRQVHFLTPRADPPRSSFNPSWSPDGTHIAFTRFRYNEAVQKAFGDIWVMRWNGEHKHPVVRSDLFEYRSDWGVAPQI
jgi:Tol biopolymer transport system component